jgi:hypothetical protein
MDTATPTPAPTPHAIAAELDEIAAELRAAELDRLLVARAVSKEVEKRILEQADKRAKAARKRLFDLAVGRTS